MRVSQVLVHLRERKKVRVNRGDISKGLNPNWIGLFGQDASRRGEGTC